MTPILFEKNETLFNDNGIGRLTDAISCYVEENLNGLYELEMEYPMSGQHYSDLSESRIILAEPFEGGNWQPFVIYRISRPLNGIVTVNAEHISYMLNKIVVMPYEASSCAQALSFLPDHTANECPFTFSTDKSVIGNFSVTYPRPVRGLLGGTEGSILDVYGKGEYEFDRFHVTLHLNRGEDRGATIRYGKNMTELIRDSDISDVYTGIVPYWTGSETTVTLPEEVVWSVHRHLFPYDIVTAVDMSNKWMDEPTVEQLRQEAISYVEQNEGWKIADSVKVSFVALWQTEEYKNIASVERVHLGDTVTVIYDALGVSVSAEVNKTIYDCLTERYVSIELGKKKNDLGQNIRKSIVPDVIRESTSVTEKAIKYATDVLTGATGGHVVIGRNADGTPNEIFIMDADNADDAEQVLRINMNGIGFSTHGLPGPYETAWTIDGHFVADYIDSGTLNANVIRAGILQDVGGKNWWNLLTGQLHLDSESIDSDFVTHAQLDVAEGRIKAEVVEEVGKGVIFHIIPTDNGQTVTLRADVHLNSYQATKTFPAVYFKWYKKTEDGLEYLGYGYEITVIKSEYGYGGEVLAVFLMLEDCYPINRQGQWVFTLFGSLNYLAVAQGRLMFPSSYPVIWADSEDTNSVYPVFGYDYERSQNG